VTCRVCLSSLKAGDLFCSLLRGGGPPSRWRTAACFGDRGRRPHCRRT